MVYVPNEPLSRLVGRNLVSETPGYRDAFCSLLSEAVVSTGEATGLGLIIEFETGRVRLHPARGDLEGPEIAMLSGFDDRAWMVWRPGEESFEDLA